MKLNIAALLFAYVAAAFVMQLAMANIAAYHKTIIRRPIIPIGRPVRPVPKIVRPVVPIPRRVPQPNYGDRFAAGINGGTFGGYIKEDNRGGDRYGRYRYKSVDAVNIERSKVGLYGKEQ